VNNNTIFLEMHVTEYISQIKSETIDESTKNSLRRFIQWAAKEENGLALGKMYKQFANIDFENYIINEMNSSLFRQGGESIERFRSVLRFLKITNIEQLKDIVELIKEYDIFDYNPHKRFWREP